MKRTMITLIALGLLLTMLPAQAPVSYLLPLWTSGRWRYVPLGSSFVVGSTVETSFAPAANEIYILTVPQLTVTLKCDAADIYRNGLLQTEGQDYSVTALKATWVAAATPQDGDIVKVTYRCR